MRQEHVLLRGVGCGAGNLLKMGALFSKSKPSQCHNFSFLEDTNTIEVIKEAHTFFILRGLPGSGKTTIAKQITERYPLISASVSADALKICPQEESEDDSSRYSKLDQQIEQCFEDGKKVIVVDDTHHYRQRLDYLFELARKKDYIVFLVDCRNPKSNDLNVLAKCSHWKLPVQSIKMMETSVKQIIIPYFFGWFLVKQDAEKMCEIAMDFLDQLSKTEAFLQEFEKHVNLDSKDGFNLQKYFQKKSSMLHCTTMFCDYGKVPNCESYAVDEVVNNSLHKSFVLKVSALFVTPRTVGARVLLDEQQQQLWPKAEEENEIKMGLPRTSRSHITLACAPGVDMVQTGIDLLTILKDEKKGKLEQVMIKQGPLWCLGDGQWIVNLPKPIQVKTLFSGFYAKDFEGK
ncbi:2',3'-cyclic-nucleotide 3'-phosphodiesterase isoform X2 [Narcine bancroftii]|uniref:2',3'-cyclic-nucleotide 3'-phosphodiesterase isoform X2 n=1 Tax=Narcine bancroftii TaxID=1343680 RepID=UPI003831F6D1